MSTDLEICGLVLRVVSTLQIPSKNSAFILKPHVEVLASCLDADIAALSSKVYELKTKNMVVDRISANLNF